MKDPYIQVQLQSGAISQLVWIPLDKRIDVGCSITLPDYEDPKLLWDVVTIWRIVPRAQLDKQREWNNNI